MTLTDEQLRERIAFLEKMQRMQLDNTPEELAALRELLAARARLREMERQIGDYQEECRQVEQYLGKALGYPWYKDDLKNFPNATDLDGVCVGEHIPSTIAAEAAHRIDTFRERLLEMEEVLRKAHKWIISTRTSTSRSSEQLLLSLERALSQPAESRAK